MSSPFIHLHTHSHYSLLDGLSKINALIARAKKYGMPALAITDHGNLHAAIEFYKAARSAGISPIVGVEAYIANRTRFDKEPGIDNKRFHLTLLAKNTMGYKNLLKLVTASHLEGYYYKPRMDRELLSAHTEGIIALSGCMGGEVSRALERGADEEAERIAIEYRDLFGPENYFLEIMHHPVIPGQEKLTRAIAALGARLNIPLVATQDSHYLDPDDKRAHQTLLAVQTGNDIGESDLFKDEEDFSFISSEEAWKRFKDFPEAVENTLRIAERCAVDIELGSWVFPDFKTPSGRSHHDELTHLTEAGLTFRNIPRTKEVEERVRYELEVIGNKGYAPYFLTVADLLRFARERGILTTTRGSAAGSMVSYLTGITNVDPLAYGLPFERFLNPYRPSPPDIDMDFADNRRDEVIEYARHQYGEEHVAQIGTFGTMLARGVVRDVARALGHPYALGDKISRLIPMGSQGFPMTIKHAFEVEPELKKMYDTEEQVHEVIDLGKKLEGCVRHVSVHAAGVVISPTPLTDFVPLQFDPKGGKIITQYDMHAVEDAGLLKFDFLGIRNLSILADSIKITQESTNERVEIENVPLDDKITFDLLGRGETSALFQLAGGGMTRHLKDLKPTSIHDINAMVALYRPGPMANIPEYIARKHGRKPITYYHPKMKKFLERSYGILVYQEDLLMTALELAGYTWESVDKFRKAVGKKIPEEMAKQHKIFVEGCIKHSGMTEAQAEEIWKLFEPFQGYGFNCIAGDTKITDARSGRRTSVYELYKNNKRIHIHTLNKDLKLEIRPTRAVLKNGRKKTYRLQTRTGKIITATENHPLYTINGWRNLEDLMPGERIAIVRTLPLNASTNIEVYKAIVLGYLLAEGNFCHPHGVYFYSKSEDELEDFSASCKKFPNIRLSLNRSKPAVSIYVGQEKQPIGNPVKQWICDLGLNYKRATEKFIPACVFEWDHEVLAAFLGKMWQGDGAVVAEGFYLFYATSSEELAHALQHLLLRFGIVSTFYKKTFKYRGTLRPGYVIKISHRDNVLAFAKTIGVHLIGQKKALLQKLCDDAAHMSALHGTHPARGTKDIIPAAILSPIRALIAEQSLSVATLVQTTRLSERLFGHDSKKIGYQREVIGIIGEALNSPLLKNLAESHIYWDEVVAVEYAGIQMTYDLTVPPHGNFVANDIIVHNSAHAASYGKVAYQTAYMKANFPVEYMSAVLTADSGDVEKISETIAECARMGIPVLPPDVNESAGGFTIVPVDTRDNNKKVADPKEKQTKAKIRFGLYTIKNFGEGIANTIITERKRGGKFISLTDFLERVQDRNVSKKSLEALIMSGAMDEFGERGKMLANMEKLLAFNRNAGAGPSAQTSLFSLMNIEDRPRATLTLEEAEPALKTAKLAWEKELLGLYLSGHPLDEHREKLEGRSADIRRVKAELSEGMLGVVAGLIENSKQVLTKQGQKMIFMTIADFTDKIEVVVFPRVFSQYNALLAPEKCISIKGRISSRNGEKSLVAEQVKEL